MPGSTIKPPTALARRLVQLRLEAGLTSDAAGARIDTAGNTWLQWEAGRRLPPSEILAVIAQKFAVNRGELLRLRNPEGAELDTVIAAWPWLSRAMRRTILGLAARAQRRASAQKGSAEVHVSGRTRHNAWVDATRCALCGAGRKLSPSVDAKVKELAVKLSKRQHDVIRLLSLGCSAREAACILGLKSQTVYNHRRRAMTVLGKLESVRLARFAIRSGISPLDDMLTEEEERRRTTAVPNKRPF